MNTQHTILMGDPEFFAVKGGANPHTRDRWGRRKSVDCALAIRQWRNLRSLLEEHGFRVHVIAPDPNLPGLVYPANAGARIGDDFILSNLTPTRADEAPIYERTVASLGLRVRRIARRFEGEADLFPAGSNMIYTSGRLERQRYRFRWGLPPWRRVYGFRSDRAAVDEIVAIASPSAPVLRLTLVDERYYHGDTCVCSFGKNRTHLLAWLAALAPESATLLRDRYGGNLIALERADAEIYAANSFAFERSHDAFLVMPAGASETLTRAIRDRGVTILSIDVSEFLRKGGGSVKCMIGDLGFLAPSAREGGF